MKRESDSKEMEALRYSRSLLTSITCGSDHGTVMGGERHVERPFRRYHYSLSSCITTSHFIYHSLHVPLLPLVAASVRRMRWVTRDKGMRNRQM